MDDKAKADELWNAHQQRIGREKVDHEAWVKTLWTERAERRGKAAVFATLFNLVLPLLGVAATGYGGWLYIKASELISRGPGTAPVGSVIAWPAEAPPPDGWRKCDGTHVAFEDHLWSALRGLYSNPNQDTVERIQLPDFRGYFLRGQGKGSDDLGAAQPAAVNPSDILWRRQGVKTSPRPGSIAAGVGSTGPVFLEAVPVSAIPREDEQVSSETRPDNYAVHWIMRVK